MADREIRIKVVVDEKGSISRLGSSLSGAQKSAGGLVGSLRGLTGVMSVIAGSAAIGAIARLGGAAVQAARDAERINVVLTAATGSAALAAQEFDRFSEISNRLGLNIRESADDFAKFLAAARGTSLEGQKAAEIFENVASAMSGLQLSGAQSSRILAAMQQIISKGVVSSEELRVQLGDLLPGAMQVAAESTGKTVQEFTAMLARGEVLAEDFLPKFAALLADRFPAAVDSTQASMNRLQNTLFEMQSEIGKGLLPALVGMADQLSSTIQSSDGATSGLRRFVAGIGFVVQVGLSLLQLLDGVDSLFGLASAAMHRAAAAALNFAADVLDGVAAVNEFIPGMGAAAEQARKFADSLRIGANIASFKAIEQHAESVEDLIEQYEQWKRNIDAAGDAFAEATVDADGLAVAAGTAAPPIDDAAGAIEETGQAASEAAQALEELGGAYESVIDLTTRSQGVAQIADDVSELNKNTRQAATREVPDLTESYSLLFDTVERVFDVMGEDEWSNVARSISNVVQSVVALINVLDKVSDAAGQVKASMDQVNAASQQIAPSGTQAATNTGLSLSTVLGWVNVYIAAYQAFVALAKALSGPDVDKFGGRFEYGEGGFDFAAVRRAPGEKTPSPGTQNEPAREFVNQFNEFLNRTMTQIGLELPATMEGFLIQFEKVVTEGQGEVFRVLIDGFWASFGTAEEAINYATQQFIEAAVASGASIDEAVLQVIQGFGGAFEDYERFDEAIARVQGLAEAADIALLGISPLEIEIRKLPASLQALRQELNALGLSADQVERLVGGQLVASLQAWREQITGQGLSIAEQQAQQKAQAALFNAERALRIAELEARRAGLEADLNLTRAEIELIRDGVLGYEQALRAKGELYGAEIELLVKQIEAINEILDALANIPEINLGTLRLPGVPSIPRIGGGGGGTSGPSGPTLEDRIGELIDAMLGSIRAQQELVNEIRDSLTGLESFLGDLRLTGPTPLSPTEQVARLRAQLTAAAKAAEGGDLQAISEFQRIAQALQQIGAEAFGTAGSGFEALLREIEHLGGDILEENNEILEREQDILSDIRDEFADLLEATQDLHDLTAEQIRATREGTDSETGVQLDIRRELEQARQESRDDLRALRDELTKLGRVITDMAA